MSGSHGNHIRSLVSSLSGFVFVHLSTSGLNWFVKVFSPEKSHYVNWHSVMSRREAVEAVPEHNIYARWLALTTKMDDAELSLSICSTYDYRWRINRISFDQIEDLNVAHQHQHQHCIRAEERANAWNKSLAKQTLFRCVTFHLMRGYVHDWMPVCMLQLANESKCLLSVCNGAGIWSSQKHI